MSYVGERPWQPITSPDKEGKSERLAGEGDTIKFIDLRLKRRQVLGSQEQKPFNK